MIIRIKLFYMSLLAAFFCYGLQCASPTAGGGTLGGNPIISGKIVTEDGNGSGDTRVCFFPHEHDPVKDGELPVSNSKITDHKGMYSIQLSDTGRYTLYAINQNENTSAYVRTIHVVGDSNTVLDAELRTPGYIRVDVSTLSALDGGYLYIPGTDIVAHLDSAKSRIVIPAPAASMPLFYRSEINPSSSITIADSVTVESGDTADIMAGWSFSKKIVLNTTATGADTRQAIENFPVLIRLTSDNLDFSKAGTNGEDIRFTSSGGQMLPYEIEDWDQTASLAHIWVKIDQILPQNDEQFFVMHWGNDNCTNASNSIAVFDTSAGFQGVYHLNESTNQNALDATENGFNGTQTDIQPSEGVVGQGSFFNGSSSVIRLDGTAEGKLNFPSSGHYTLSFWALADSAESNLHVLGKGNLQYNIKIDAKRWYFAEYRNSSPQGWHHTVSPYTPLLWTLVTGVVTGNSQYLYVNGICVDSTIQVNQDTSVRDTSQDVHIGCRYEPDGEVGFYGGRLDEVRLSNVPRAPEWIWLSYVNQKGERPFVQIQ